jgi:hypothetical protein
LARVLDVREASAFLNAPRGVEVFAIRGAASWDAQDADGSTFVYETVLRT